MLLNIWSGHIWLKRVRPRTAAGPSGHVDVAFGTCPTLPGTPRDVAVPCTNPGAVSAPFQHQIPLSVFESRLLLGWGGCVGKLDFGDLPLSQKAAVHNFSKRA